MSAWYRTGTVSITSGTATVTGTGTYFSSVAKLKTGDLFTYDGSKFYEIATVDSDTQLTLNDNYAETTLAASAYACLSNFNSTLTSSLAAQLASLLNKWQGREDEMADWLGGTGQVTLTDAVGNSALVDTPAEQQSKVDTKIAEVEAVIGTTHATIEADFNRLAEAVRAEMAGSGFVEWGKHYLGSSKINQGLYVEDVAGAKSWLGLGRGVSTQGGTSKTEFPLVNVNGALLNVELVNNSIARNEILFPTAPTATNLVTNGTFDTDTSGWTLGGDGSISAVGGELRVDYGTNITTANQTISVVTGQTYLVEFTAREVTTTTGIMRITGGADETITIDSTADRTIRHEFTATGSSITVFCRLDSVGSVYFDNISIIDKADLSRQDLCFLESWHELVSDKDFVYPYGNVQYGATTFDGVSLVNNVVAAGYSAFGEWESSPTAGYGAVWSTLSAANKAKFLAEPLNNIYQNEDGDLVQVRYRIRTVAGLGDDWRNVDPQDEEALSYSNTAYVTTQGSSTTAKGLDSFSSGYFEGANDINWVPKLDHTNGTQGQFYAVNGSGAEATTIAYNGLCFALPIALVQRRNQGAYHPVLNPNGTAWLNNTTLSSSGEWYDAGIIQPSTTFDCMTPVNISADNTTAGYATITGYISSTYSGRPDGLFYDAIYASDVKDLRNDANKVQDYSRLMEREFNRLVAGELRGFEQAREILGTSPATVSASGTTYTPGGDAPAVDGLNTQGNGIRVTGVSGMFPGTDDYWECFVVLSPTDVRRGVYYEVSSSYYVRHTGAVISTSTEVTLVFFSTKNNASFGTLPATTKLAFSGETILHCDIIGDPANYFRGHYDWESADGTQTVTVGEVIRVSSGHSAGGTVGSFYESNRNGTFDLSINDYTNATNWKPLGTDRAGSWVTEGVFGTPLLVDEDGNSLIPNGTSKTFKFSRKVETELLALFSDDGGNTWGTFSASINTTTNSRTASTPTGQMHMIFYTTKANPTELASNDEVLALGDVFTSVGAGVADFISAMVGKMPINAASGRWQDVAPIRGIIDNRGLSSGGTNWLELSLSSLTTSRHDTLELAAPLTPYPSTAKVLPYLSRDNGRGYLHLLYKEMVFDTGADTSGDFTSITESTTTKTAGEKYKVTDGLFEGYWVWKITTAAQLSTSAFYEYDGNLYYDKIANGIFATRWDGNGWGDDNTFTVLDNESTETDDNGNTIIVGQRRIALPNFIGEGE